MEVIMITHQIQVTPKIELYDKVFTVDGTGATIVQQ